MAGESPLRRVILARRLPGHLFYLLSGSQDGHTVAAYGPLRPEIWYWDGELATTVGLKDFADELMWIACLHTTEWTGGQRWQRIADYAIQEGQQGFRRVWPPIRREETV